MTEEEKRNESKVDSHKLFYCLIFPRTLAYYTVQQNAIKCNAFYDYYFSVIAIIRYKQLVPFNNKSC